VEVPVRVARGKDLAGAVKVELVLAEHIRGVRAEPLTLAAGESKGVLKVHFDKGPLGPFNLLAVVRATLSGSGGPAVAETKLEFVAE
jgi:hypothetical protein